MAKKFKGDGSPQPGPSHIPGQALQTPRPTGSAPHPGQASPLGSHTSAILPGYDFDPSDTFDDIDPGPANVDKPGPSGKVPVDIRPGDGSSANQPASPQPSGSATHGQAQEEYLLKPLLIPEKFRDLNEATASIKSEVDSIAGSPEKAYQFNGLNDYKKSPLFNPSIATVVENSFKRASEKLGAVIARLTNPSEHNYLHDYLRSAFGTDNIQIINESMGKLYAVATRIKGLVDFHIKSNYENIVFFGEHNYRPHGVWVSGFASVFDPANRIALNVGPIATDLQSFPGLSYSERLTDTIIHEGTHNEIATKDLLFTPTTPRAIRLANAKDMRLYFEKNMDLRNIPAQQKNVALANLMFDNADSYAVWFDQLAKRKPADATVFDRPDSPTPIVGSTAETPDSY